MRRRDFIAGFGAAAWPLLASAQEPAPATALFQLQSLDHVSLSVADGQRTIDFYRPIFGQEIYHRPNTASEFRISLGGTPYLAVNPGRNIPPGTVDHFCIGVKNSIEQIRSILGREGIAFTEDLLVKDEDGTFVQFYQSADINPSIAIKLYPRTPTVMGLQPVFSTYRN